MLYPDRDELVSSEEFIRSINGRNANRDLANEKKKEEGKVSNKDSDEESLSSDSSDSELTDSEEEDESFSEFSDDEMEQFNKLRFSKKVENCSFTVVPEEQKCGQQIDKASVERSEEKSEQLEAKAFLKCMLGLHSSTGSTGTSFADMMAKEIAVQKRILALGKKLQNIKVNEEECVRTKGPIDDVDEMDEKDEKMRKLKKQYWKVANRLDDALDRIWELETKISEMKAEKKSVLSMQDIIEKQCADFETLKSAIYENQKTFNFGKTMSDKYWGLVEEEKKWILEIQHLMTLVEDQKKESGEKDQQIRYLEKKIEILMEKVEGVKKQEAKTQKEVTKDEMELTKKKMQNLETILRAKSEQVQTITNRLHSVEKEFADNYEKFEMKSSEIRKQKEENERKLTEELDKAKKQIVYLTQQVQGFKHMALMEKNDRKDGWSRVAKLKETVQRQENEIQNLKMCISNASGQKQDETDLTQQLNAQTHRISDLEAELAEYKDQDKHMEAQILGLTADYEDQKKQLEKFKRQRASMNSRHDMEMTAKDDSIKKLEAELNFRERRMTDQNNELRQKDDKIRSLQRELQKYTSNPRLSNQDHDNSLGASNDDGNYRGCSRNYGGFSNLGNNSHCGTSSRRGHSNQNRFGRQSGSGSGYY